VNIEGNDLVHDEGSLITKIIDDVSFIMNYSMRLVIFNCLSCFKLLFAYTHFVCTIMMMKIFKFLDLRFLVKNGILIERMMCVNPNLLKIFFNNIRWDKITIFWLWSSLVSVIQIVIVCDTMMKKWRQLYTCKKKRKKMIYINIFWSCLKYTNNKVD